MQLFFSIIITIYNNTEECISRCLDSIASQSFDLDRIQIIAINDNSPRSKECENILELYKNRLHIDYIKLPEHKGTHIARKRGVESVKGEYLMFVDPNDYLEKNALTTLHYDIQTNGKADYIEFNTSQLRRGIFKLKFSFLLPKDAKTNAIDVDYNDGGHQTRVFNKCFRSTFAMPIYTEMAEEYIVFATDFYQTCVLDYFAKNRRIVQKYLYVYVVSTGVTTEQIYSKEKIKEMLLKSSNIEKHLSSFYYKHKDEDYIEKVKKHSLEMELYLMERSNLEDFIECCKEILDEETLETLLLKYLGRTTEMVRTQRKGLPAMLAKLKRYLKRRFRQ